jgi:inner membrane protein
MLSFIKNIIRSKPGSVTIVALLLLIPLALIESKISERSQFHDKAVAEVSHSWTGAQTVMGPVMVIEYETVSEESYWSKTEEKFLTRTKYSDQTAILPMNQLRIDARIDTQKRYRGIHEVQVYTSAVTLNGEYQPNELKRVLERQDFHQTRQIYLWINVSDQRGFVDIPALTWGSSHFQFSPGGHTLLQERGLKVVLQTEDVLEPILFESQFSLKGTLLLNVVPTGRTTELNLTSAWPHPKFVGQYLPTTRTLDNGFSARWQITELATNIGRDLSNCATGKCDALLSNHFGVELIEPVDMYLMTERAVKYALLFVGLVFALVMAGEINRAVEVHPIQYLMIGVGLSIFYLLLVATSEHIKFEYAYVIATTMCSALLTYYGTHIFQSRSVGFGFGGVITMLFGLLFVVINAEDIALLLGTLITFAVVTALMVVTRNIEQLRVFANGFWEQNDSEPA